MAHDFLIYDFGTDEETAQSARRKVEGWAQSYRLGKKLAFKFDREEPEGGEDDDGSEAAASREREHDHERDEKARHAKDGTKSARAPKKTSGDERAGRVHGIVRLDFSPHEKLSHQRWLERIPTEEPFKSAKGKTVRSGHADYADAVERFDSLT
jgi:hypothetical protein